MMELDTPDTIVRNYAIDCDYAGNRIIATYDSIFFMLGLSLMGFKSSGVDKHTALSEILAALRSKGLDLPDITIMGYLAQFYVYNSIKKGERQRWPKRRTHSSL
jgi:hypothetical protein